MMGRCIVCGGAIRSSRSRTYCTSHYWRLRRLAQKPRFELERIASEADHTKTLISIVLEREPTDCGVADLQRGDALPSERDEDDGDDETNVTT